MKILLFLLVFLISFIFPLAVKAEVGCQIGNTIYTSLNGNIDVTILLVVVSVRNYNNPNLSTLPPACPRATNISPITGGLGVRTCVANGNILPLGNVVNYDRLDPPIQCPLDDYSLPFAAAAGALGLFYIRRTKN